MLKKLIILFLILIPLVYAIPSSSSSLNFLDILQGNKKYCHEDGTNCKFDWLNSEYVGFYINVESCMVDLCIINASVAIDNEYVMVAEPGRIFLLVSEPNV